LPAPTRRQICSSRHVRRSIPHNLGVAQIAYPIPAQPLFVGMHYYLQALVPDSAAGNALSALVSNAIVATIGSR